MLKTTTTQKTKARNTAYGAYNKVYPMPQEIDDGSLEKFKQYLKAKWQNSCGDFEEFRNSRLT